MAALAELRRATGQIRRTARDVGFATAFRFGLDTLRFVLTSVPAVRFVTDLTGARPEEVQEWLREGRRWTRTMAGAWDKGSGAVSRGDFAVLYSVVRATQPRAVLETGTRAGVSTTAMAYAMSENGGGLVHTVDWRKPRNAEGAPYRHELGALIPEELVCYVRRHEGDVRRVLPELLESVEPEVVLFDDVHYPEHHAWEARTAMDRLRPGSIVLCDDVTVGWVEATESWRNCRFLAGVVR